MLTNLKKLKGLYKDGENIIDFLKQNYGENYDINQYAEISYDLQAGSYIKKAQENPFDERERGEEFAKVLNQFGNYKSIIECGVGEGTSHSSIIPFLSNDDYKFLGFDVSYSRIQYARSHLSINYRSISNELFLGDYFNCPLGDNSVEVVYTVHSMEPSGGKEIDILRELFRVTSKYLVLFEPSFELGSSSTREYIEKRGYVKNLYQYAKDLNFNIIEHKLLFEDNDRTPNNTAVIVIEKDQDFTETQLNQIDWACPITKKQLKEMNDCFYSKESFLLYPKINSIPCLLPKNAIIASHFSSFD